jgi:hypothetical protein
MPEYLPLDPAKYLQVSYTMVPVSVPPEHAANNAVLDRWQIVVPDDNLELFAERRKGDWRLMLPNGKIVLANTERDANCIIRGILIGRDITRQEARQDTAI